MDNKNNSLYLGLPIEYQQLPAFFDAHNINKETVTKNALIATLLKEQNVKSVLDMTCGTGSQVFYLNEQGFEIVGSDFSPGLIDIARNKAKHLNQAITFLTGDMRNVKVGHFDAVITIFNAIGHLSQFDFHIALKNIRANLLAGGIYVFDIFNLEAITDDVIKQFTMEIKTVVDNIQIENNQHSEIDREKGLLTSHDHYTIVREGEKPEIKTNRFSLQLYKLGQLKLLLNNNGFEIIKLLDFNGEKFKADKSLSMLIVAKMQS